MDIVTFLVLVIVAVALYVHCSLRIEELETKLKNHKSLRMHGPDVDED